LVSWYLSAFKYVAIVVAIGGLAAAMFFSVTAKPEVIVTAFDPVNNNRIVGVRNERSVMELEMYLKGGGSTLSQQFLNDSVWVMHGKKLNLVDYLDDSVIVEVQLYDAKYSHEVFALRSNVKFE